MKSFPLEKIIARHIKAGLPIEKIAQKISGHSDTMEVGRFFYNAGLIKDLFQLAIDQMKQDKLVPWPFVIQSLTDHKIDISKKNAKILYKNMLMKQEKESVPYIFACRNWGEDFKEFELFRSVFLERLQEEHANIRQELLKNLEFVQSQGLLGEEERVINQLLEIEGDSEEYLLLQKKLKEKKALQFVKNKKLSHQQKALHEKRILPFVPKESYLKEQLFADIYKLAQTYPEKIKNLSVFLYMMGWPDMGLNLFDKAKVTVGEGVWLLFGMAF